MKIYRLLPVVLCGVFFNFCRAQNYIGLREVVNFEKRQYHAGAQNWDICQDVQGRIYFANNEGLLCFDGVYWNSYPLPNKTIVRSIAMAADHRIYVGGQDEIGYFSPNASSKLIYHSLKPLLPEEDRNFADTWEVETLGNEVFFQTHNKIFRYANGQIQVLKTGGAWLFLGLHEGHMLAQDFDLGILRFYHGAWTPFILKEKLPPDFDITTAMPLGGDSSLLVVHKKGLYLLTGNQLQPFNLSGIPIDPYQEFSGSIKIDADHFIVGSYTNGFYRISREGVVLENFSKREGLQNSNVRSLFCDRTGNIWLGLESGIDFIAFNTAIKHINPPIMNDGAGYGVATWNGQFFFALSNGLYRLTDPGIPDLSYARDDFTALAGGQTWGLVQMGNKLLAGKDEGFFELVGNKLIPVAKNSGYWTFEPLPQAHAGNLLVAGNYHGLRLFEIKGDRIGTLASIPGFNESARFLVVDQDNTVWVSHPYRGVYKIRLPIDGGLPTVKRYDQKNGLPSSLNNHVYKVKNRVVIATEKGVYAYDSRSDSFQPSGYFKPLFGEQSVRYLKEDPDGNLWFVQEKNLGVVDYSLDEPAIIYLPELNGKILSGFEHVFPLNAQNIFVGGEKGFYHINLAKYRQHNHELSVYIRTVKARAKTDSILFGGYFGEVNEDKWQPADQLPSLGHQWNSIHIEYAAPIFDQQSNVEYSYWLDGFDKDWSDWSSRTEKDYTNLPAGSYTFRVKARNNLRDESVSSSFLFAVLPPWYQTYWAKFIYFILIVLMAYLVSNRQRKKLLKERQKHQEEQQRLAYLHQLELEKSEKEVVKLRNEKLETEIEFKNSELASTAMHLVQKEAFLSKIKDELQHLNKAAKEDKPDAADLKKILRILSEEEKLNEEWEQFSVHFNKVHSDFLIMLKEKYPSLKAHELKLCAYLRMNLSSKEIAQLMSISVRGVEISRYRLRKKLQVPTETNLFQFLFDIHLSNNSPANGTAHE